MELVSPYSSVVTICTTTFKNKNFCALSTQCIYVFVWIWEQTAIISLYSTNWLVFITDIVFIAPYGLEMLGMKTFTTLDKVKSNTQSRRCNVPESTTTVQVSSRYNCCQQLPEQHAVTFTLALRTADTKCVNSAHSTTCNHKVLQVVSQKLLLVGRYQLLKSHLYGRNWHLFRRSTGLLLQTAGKHKAIDGSGSAVVFTGLLAMRPAFEGVILFTRCSKASSWFMTIDQAIS